MHLIVDNYATHKHPNVQKWLAKHPRLHMHFTPTSASWLNMVERFFRDITDKRLRCGVITSVPERQQPLKYQTECSRAGFESDPNVPQQPPCTVLAARIDEEVSLGVPSFLVHRALGFRLGSHP